MTRLNRHNKNDNWNTSQAKESLSEVIAAAQRRPQIIMNREKKVAVLMSFEEYSKVARVLQQKNLSEIMRGAQKIAKEENIDLVTPTRSNRSIEF